jgi:hypothetical protein
MPKSSAYNPWAEPMLIFWGGGFVDQRKRELKFKSKG